MIKPQGFLFDLDGVVFQGDSLIGGAKNILSILRSSKIPHRFITNTTRMTKKKLINTLYGMGLSVSHEDIFTAPLAAVEYCKMKRYNKIALFVPDEEMVDDFSAFELVENKPDAVVLSDMGTLFTFNILNRLFQLLLEGAELVAMHKNRYWVPSGGVFTLDLGSFVSALEYATGKPAIIMGKPNANLFKLAIKSWDLSEDSIYMVGDDIHSDIGGAQNAGMKSVLVKTGKFNENTIKNSKIVPDYIINSIADLSILFDLN